jgi:hypothetical protein
LKSDEVPKMIRAIDLERTCGKHFATLGEITPEEREGIGKELSKARDLEFI